MKWAIPFQLQDSPKERTRNYQAAFRENGEMWETPGMWPPTIGWKNSRYLIRLRALVQKNGGVGPV